MKKKTKSTKRKTVTLGLSPNMAATAPAWAEFHGWTPPGDPSPLWLGAAALTRELRLLRKTLQILCRVQTTANIAAMIMDSDSDIALKDAIECAETIYGEVADQERRRRKQ